MSEKKHQSFKILDKLNKAQKNQTSIEVSPGQELILLYSFKKDMPSKLPCQLSVKSMGEIPYEELFELRKKMFTDLRAKRDTERKGNLEQVKITRLHELNFTKDAIGTTVEKLSVLTDTTAEVIFKKYGIDTANFN